MRLFVSLRPPPTVRRHLASVLAGLRTTDIEQWHLTGVHLEQRLYRPHVRVARGAVDADVLQGYRGPQWQAVSAELVRSQLGARAVHQVLDRLPLGAS